MFSKSIRNKLSKHFSTPVRYKHLQEHTERIIGQTRYSIVSNLVHDLLENGVVNSYKLTTKDGRFVTLCCSRQLDKLNPYEIAQAMFPKEYFCNLSSIYYHSLTNQIPKTIYICYEKMPAKRKNVDAINSNKLRSAFIKPHRHTSHVYTINNCEVIVVERTKIPDSGVVESHTPSTLFPNTSRVTCIERAMVDAVVSPQYNGGIVSVNTYFRNARGMLNIARLIKIYRQLDFVYPYSQSIGFLLDRNGMSKHASVIYKNFPPEYSFFVDHNAKTTWVYDKKWKLYYPTGLVDEN
ncbi:MAG: type IV toxin-antitoxin system AbiEi family antitoxin domain-containing protein [Candidatus Anammoxibacter sp.]